MSLIDLMDKMTCVRCGHCRHFTDTWARACPSGTKYISEMYYTSGRAWIAEALALDKIELTRDIMQYIYSCAMCNACMEICTLPYKDHGMDIMLALREECVERGLPAPKAQEFMEKVYLHGNPYGLPRKKRGEWARGLDIPLYKKGDEYLFYIGCVGSYDTRSMENAKALGRLFVKTGLSFGILGDREICDGNEVKNLGERALFEELVEKQGRLFKELEVKKIVTLSPHANHAMKNDYPKKGVNVEVVHYTRLLAELIKNGRLDVSNGFNERVTYHDPCYLGRWNDEYEAPREILNALPGIDLVEMKRHKNTSYCCGGGGGNFYTDFLSGERSPANLRVMEAHDTGAAVLAVACPICTIMFSDAVKTSGLEGTLRVMDISEIVTAACPG